MLRGENISEKNIKLIEGYKNALSSMPDSLMEAKECVKRRYAELEKNSGTQALDIPDTAMSLIVDDNAPFYEVLYRLKLSSDIESCKKAATMLKDYLTEKPGCVMGEMMLEVIGEQLED